MKTRKAKPSQTQAMWLRRIALSPVMIKTYIGNKVPVYSLANGEEIPPMIAAKLIQRGWVKGQKDGMFDDPQTYVALKP